VSTGSRKLRAWICDHRGSAAVEFALIGLPFLLTLVAFMESAFDMFCMNALDNAVQIAARQIMTGQIQGATHQISAAQFNGSVLCPLLPSAFNCANLIVNIQTFSIGGSSGGFYSFVNSAHSGLKTPSGTSYCLGTGGQYVFVQVLYPMPLLTTAFLKAATSYNGQNVLMLSSGAAFRNEPFQAPGYNPPAGC